jgi:hypothetical protein
VLEEVGGYAGAALDDRGQPNGSMGVDAGDFDRSGLASIIVTNYENELPALYQNRSVPGQEVFTYATQRTGIAVIGGSYVSWGVGFCDYDHDGWEDVVIASGHAIRYPVKTDRRQKPVLLHNERGRFTVVTPQGGPYFRSPHNARGVALGDLDNDGKIDLVVSHMNEPVAVLRGVAPTEGRHWVGVELVGERNRDVVGARVVLDGSPPQTRFAKGGASFASTNDQRLVFGLGAAAAAGKVTVYWPSGRVQEYAGLKPDSYWRLVEGDPDPRPAPPAKP